MRYVLPVRVFLNAVIEHRCPPGEFPNRTVANTPAAFGTRVRLCNVFLNPLLEPTPLFFRRFGFHLPEHYRSVTA
jgi:hypothetical protein